MPTRNCRRRSLWHFLSARRSKGSASSNLLSTDQKACHERSESLLGQGCSTVLSCLQAIKRQVCNYFAPTRYNQCASQEAMVRQLVNYLAPTRYSQWISQSHYLSCPSVHSCLQTREHQKYLVNYFMPTAWYNYNSLGSVDQRQNLAASVLNYQSELAQKTQSSDCWRRQARCLIPEPPRDRFPQIHHRLQSYRWLSSGRLSQGGHYVARSGSSPSDWQDYARLGAACSGYQQAAAVV